MSNTALRQRLLATTIVAGVLFAAPAFAQTTPGAGATPSEPVVGGSSANATPTETNGTDAQGNAQAADTNEVTVTGSRIASPNLTSTSPLTVVSAAEVKLQGTTRVEDLLNSLPQVFASQGSTDANGATGIATVDLRNLGSIRTLVLINGRRLVPGDPTSPSADLNFIPASLIQRVDILTGGASSIYGSDAVAGVVNFILNKDFTGVQLDAQYSLYNHDNRANDTIRNALNARNFGFPDGISNGGAQRTVTLTVGTGTDDGRGHVTAYANYRSADAVTAADRDFSSCQLTFGATTASCGGSSTAAAGRFQQTSLAGFAAGQPIYAPSSGSFTVTGNNFRPYVGAQDAFNFNPYNYFQRPDKRYTFGTFAHYEVSKSFDPYLEAMFMDDRTAAVIAPSGAFYGTDFFVNCNNPYLSAGQSTALCGANAGTGALQSVYIGRRNVEGGGRVDDLRHTDYRIVTGARGDIAKGVTYDAYGQLGRAILTERYGNDFSRTRLNRSLNVVNNNGTPTCAAALPNAQGQVLDANCVPYNIFQTGGVTQAALDYLQTPGLRSGSTTEWVASGSISATLGEYGIQSPFAANGIGLAVGAEYRKEKLELRNDIEFLTGDLAGQGTPFGVNDASGQFDVKEFFGELRVPLVEDRAFFQTLALGGAYRYSKYSIQGSTDTYKVDAEWAPVRDLRFRASYNRAVRAPNILELFTPATVQLFSTDTDPCAGELDTPGGNTVNGNTLAQCARTGVTAAQFGNIDQSPAGQYNQRTAGNINLTPEKADSYTVGVVIQPRFLRNFSLTVDGYDIRVKDIISTFGANFTLDQCVQTGNPLFCNRVNRATGSGSLFVGNSFVDNPNQNLGKTRTRGIDVNASYRTEAGNFGSFGFDLVGTYLDKYEVQTLPSAIDGRSYDCAGRFGLTCGTPLPKWRHSLRVSWNTPIDIQVSGKWRYFNHINNDQNADNELLGAPGTITNIDRRIGAVNYFDLAFTTRVMDKFTFRLGAQNLLDKQPPVRSFSYSSNSSTNTYTQVYDSLGRYVYAGFTLDL